MMIPGGTEPTTRFNNNRFIGDDIQNNIRIPLILPYSHQNSFSINNTAALRGISLLDAEVPTQF